MYLSSIVFIMACNGDAEKVNTDDVETSQTDQVQAEETELTLAFELSTGTAVAGTNIEYTLTFTDTSGSTPEYDFSIQSSSGEEIFYSTSLLRIQTAGTHELELTVIHNEQTYVAQQTIEITPSDLANIDLQLSDLSFAVGNTISFTTTAYDTYGNTLADIQPEILVDSVNLQVDDSTITTTIPDVYTVTAKSGEIVDAESFVVDPGPANQITLTVPNTNVEINQTLPCEVTITDAYGNDTEDDWTLWVDGTGTTTISHQNITFHDEGTYTVYAQVTGTQLLDSYGPIHVDSFGPTIVVTSPERGAWTETATATVTGNISDTSGTVVSATINTEGVNIDTNGDFAHPVSYNTGVNVLQTSALDDDGNTSSDIRSVLMGNFLASGSQVENGLTAWIGDNDNGFGAIEEYTEAELKSLDYSSLLGDDIHLGSTEICWCIWACCSTYSENLSVNNLSYDDIEVDLSTNINSRLVAVADIINPRVDFNVYGTYNSNGTVTAETISVTVIAEAVVNNSNQLELNVISVSSNTPSINLNLDGTLWSILDFLGVDGWIEDYIEDEMQSAIEDAVYDSVPDVLGDILQDLQINETFELMGNTYSFTATPKDIDISMDGLKLQMQSQFSAQNWALTETGLGSLFEDISPANWYSWNGFGVSLSMDVLNQLLYEFWGSGALLMNMDDSELGIDDGDLDIIFPNSTDMRLTVDALLPPVLVDTSGDLELQLGDVYIALHNGNYSNNDMRLELYTSIFAPVTLTSNGTSISTTIGEPTFYFDVIYPEASGSGAQSAEVLMGELIPYILPSLTSAIDEIDIPSISGFNITGVTSYVINGSLKVVGTLEIQ